MDEDDDEQRLLEAPTLCALECGFHGNAETRNLCSQCYDTVLLSESYTHLSTHTAPQADATTSSAGHPNTLATSDESRPCSKTSEPLLSSANEESSVQAIPEVCE